MVGTAVLCVPAVSVAGDSSSNPPKFATKPETSPAKNHLSNPAGTCKDQRKASNSAATNHGRTFTQFYATNRGNGRGAGRNAFGKCVSATAHKLNPNDKPDAKTHDDDRAERRSEEGAESRDNDGADNHGKGGANPAMTCKAMQKNDSAHFRIAYGTRPNAFGKCVSGHATGKTG